MQRQLSTLNFTEARTTGHTKLPTTECDKRISKRNEQQQQKKWIKIKEQRQTPVIFSLLNKKWNNEKEEKYIKKKSLSNWCWC